MSKVLTSVCAILLSLSIPAFAAEPGTLTDAQKQMIEKIESTSELKFVGLQEDDRNDPNAPIAYFEPNQAATERLRKQDKFRLDREGNVPKIRASIERLHQTLIENGPQKLCFWNDGPTLSVKAFFVNEVADQVSRLSKLLKGFDLTYSDATTELIMVERATQKSARILPSQLEPLLKDVEAMGEPVIIPPLSGHAERMHLRYDGFHQKFGESLGKALLSSQKTYLEPQHGFITYVKRDGLPHGLLVAHRFAPMEGPKLVSTLEWLAKPSTQDVIFGQQLRRKEWLKKKGFIIESMYLDRGELKYRIRHHSKKNSTDYFDSQELIVDENYDAFVKRVSKINSDYTDDPMDSWMNAPDVEQKRKLRAAKKLMDGANMTCEAVFSK